MLGRGAAFERNDIGEFGVVGHNADTLGGVHRAASADGDDTVGSRYFEGFHALLHVGDGGVGLNLGIDFIGESCLIEHVGDHFGGAHFDEAWWCPL